jgi:hypothetical protein
VDKHIGLVLYEILQDVIMMMLESRCYLVCGRDVRGAARVDKHIGLVLYETLQNLP